MPSTTISLLTLLLSVIPSLAISPSAPQKTDVTADTPNYLGWTPRPTSPARLSDLRIKKDRRQAGATNTCGYFDGDASLPISCDPGNACAYNTVNDYFGCCLTDADGSFDATDCAYIATPYTGCYDYTVASDCVGNCYLENRVCDSTAPNCATIFLDLTTATFSHYWCETGSDLATLYADPEPTTAPSSTIVTPSVITTSSVTATFFNNIHTSSTVPTSTPNVITITDGNPNDSQSTVTVQPTGTDSGTTSSSASTSSGSANSNSLTSTPSRASTPTAAIVGGVLGGLILLAGVVGGTVFWLHKKKTTERKEAALEVSQT